ncbi:hypothetical protein PVA05_17870 [Escherichia coli]|uniref:hypothetical protein n=1 Tax=Escherichia coli TaxID=562 RepID=UPI003095D932
MMSLWDALRMNMMISYQELVRTFPKCNGIEIVGVGIKTDEIIGFETDTFVTVDDTSLLSIEVSKLVHQILS